MKRVAWLSAGLLIGLVWSAVGLAATPPPKRVASSSAAKTANRSKTPAPPRKARRRLPPLQLVWHVETIDGRVVDSKLADEAINPASVTKVATTWWALERLGPDHRYETRVWARGKIDAARGVLAGDLWIEGTGDPDFQVENAFLLGRSLNDLGVRRVEGRLLVNNRFWMGWEGGRDGTNPDPSARALLMAGRLRQALAPERWSRATGATWHAYAARRGLAQGARPRVVFQKGIGTSTESSDGAGGITAGEPLLVHRSRPLAETLRRFNCYSNNDIERVGASLGPVGELSELVAATLGARAGSVQFETTSGLGENRLTPRLAVQLLRELRRTSERAGVPVEALLPVAGCDPGTVTRMFPALSEGSNATSLVGKTGTLTATDGGISVLAGFVNTAQGEMIFCVAVPRAAGRLRGARSAEERFVLNLLSRSGGPLPRSCAPPITASDDGADVLAAPRASNRSARPAAM